MVGRRRGEQCCARTVSKGCGKGCGDWRAYGFGTELFPKAAGPLTLSAINSGAFSESLTAFPPLPSPGGAAPLQRHRRQTALDALRAWPGGLHMGGGVSTSNAMEYLDAGASHVIVTSFVFREGRLEEERLKELVGVGVV